MLKIIVIPIILAAFLLSACQASSSSTENMPLVDTYWELISLKGNNPVQDSSVSAVFTQDGSVGGSAGCNTYQSSYQVDGKKMTIGIGITTLMACADDLMQQETDYLGTLALTSTFKIEGTQLILMDEQGNEILVFEGKEQELAGSSWDVIGYNNGKEAVVSTIIGSELTAEFSTDGKVSGSAGCNNYNASFETDGDTIKIGPAASTRKMCDTPEGVMDQEYAYLSAIQNAATYKIAGTKMEMRDADGAMVANFQLRP
jgi:heat shock protein HslJ